jgi:Cdc6-like AAA superfamily ATPase
MLGYEEEMRRMFKNCNPGLARRFQMENAFVFPDYNDIELLNILQHKAKAAGLRMDFDVAKRAVRSLSGARAKPHFGNAGAVENLLSGAKLQLQARGTAAQQTCGTCSREKTHAGTVEI